MLGIDVSKETLVCTLLDPASRTTRWTRSFTNSPAGVQSLLQQTPAAVAWVLEPTGRYSTGVVQQARQEGRTVLLAPPRQAQRFLQAIQSRAKTDKLDSAGLALYAVSVPLAPYPLKPAAMEQLDQLLAARKGLVTAISRLKLQAAALPHAAGPLQQAIADLKVQVAKLEQQIRTHSRQEPRLARLVAALKGVPGIGLVTATAAVSRLTAKTFAHPDQFVAYIGLDIAVRQSGKRAGELGLTKQGDAELRRLFYLCAQANLKIADSPFRAQYEREIKKGQTSTAALNAVARKLARLCWSLVKHETAYDPDRVHRQG
jgi:transposase